MNIPIVYFDLNIFNMIEKASTLDSSERKLYLSLNNYVMDKKIQVPYSNAHMRDLARGYQKNTSYMEGHLNTIKRLTNNLCITQYWNEPRARWHIRDVKEFFNSTLDEFPTPKDLSSWFDYDDGDSLISFAHRLRCDIMKTQRIDEKFKLIYRENPIFGLIYPRTKEEMTLYALTEDILNFSENIKTDYILYKNFRKYLMDLKYKYPNLTTQPEITTILKDISNANPKQISWDSVWDDLSSTYKSSSNPGFDKLFDLFVKTDIKGYRKDAKFANLIDDALHTVYGAHCNYFVTNDERCYDKAKIVYEKFAPNTKVLKPSELIAILSEQAF